MSTALSRMNPNPTMDQLLALASRAGRKVLTSSEVATLHCGIEALAAAVDPTVAAAPVSPSRREAYLQRQLDAAVRLYAELYGLTAEQAMGEIRAEAAR